MVVEKVLSSYYSLGNKAASLASVTSLYDAHDYLHWFLLDMPVVPGLLFFHALFAADRINVLTGGRQFWFKSYVLTIFAAFGGSTLAAVLSNAPAPLFTHASNYMLGYITVAWYAIDQFGPLRMICRTRLVASILAFGATAAKARAIFSFVDQYVIRYPGAMAGAIALGGLSGSGGLLFLSLERKVRSGVSAPSELSTPGWAFKSAYLVSAIYYITTDPEGLLADLPFGLKNPLPRDSVRYVLSLGLCVHAALEILLGRGMNPMYYGERMFYLVTRISDNIDVGPRPLEARTPASQAPGAGGGKSSGISRSSGSVRQRGSGKR